MVLVCTVELIRTRILIWVNMTVTHIYAQIADWLDLQRIYPQQIVQLHNHPSANSFEGSCWLSTLQTWAQTVCIRPRTININQPPINSSVLNSKWRWMLRSCSSFIPDLARLFPTQPHPIQLNSNFSVQLLTHKIVPQFSLCHFYKNDINSFHSGSELALGL